VGQAAYINDKFYSFLRRLFEIGYLKSKKLTSLFNLIMVLRKTLKVQTDFVQTKPRGTVKVTYTCSSSAVRVNVDLTGLNRAGMNQILILNEQGANFFRKYTDTDGLALRERNISAWSSVNADEASLSDNDETVAFTLRRVKAAQLFRGWENTRGRFSWAGLSYSLRSNASTFSYDIKIRSR
jgi:hypothetical protein